MSKYHAELTGTDIHDPKLHASYHEVGGSDLVNHNDLTGVLGGTSGEYYHFTSADYNEITGWLSAVTASTDGSLDLGAGNITTTGTITAEQFNGTGINGLYQDGADFITNGLLWYPFYVEGTATLGTDAWMKFDANTLRVELGVTATDPFWYVTAGGSVWSAASITAGGGLYSSGNNQLGGDTVFGSATYSSNISLSFYTDGSDGLLYWDKTNDRFDFYDDIFMNTSEAVIFGGTSNYIVDSGGNLKIQTAGLLEVVGSIVLTAGNDIRPSVDSTTAINIAQADGTDFITYDTTNKYITLTETKTLSNYANSDTTMLISRANDTGTNPFIFTRVAGGTFASPTNTKDNMQLGGFTGGGHDGTDWVASRGGFKLLASQDWTPTAHGSDGLLETTTNDTTLRQPRMKWANDGDIFCCYQNNDSDSLIIGSETHSAGQLNIIRTGGGGNAAYMSTNIVQILPHLYLCIGKQTEQKPFR